MRLTIRLMTACCVSAINLLAASAQDTATTQALNLDNNIVNQSLQRFSQGINIGKIAVDSTAVTSDSVKIFLNSALQNVPMRSDNVADITKALAEQLPADLKDKKLLSSALYEECMEEEDSYQKRKMKHAI